MKKTLLKVLVFMMAGIIILGTLFVILGAGVFLTINQSNGSIISSGETRKYILYTPKYFDQEEKVPLVLSLHGFSDWPAHHRIVSGWKKVADENNFILVYPMGRGFPFRWLSHTTQEEDGTPNKDITFISDLIDALSQEYNIDEDRVYVNGLSNGGGMSHLLACTLEDKITAMAGVAGAYLFPWDECQTSRPIPVILFHGNEDKIVPYAGGGSRRFDYPFPNLSKFAEKWAEHNNCDLDPQKLKGVGEISGVRYSNCDENADVVFYTVDGGGHSWPGGGGLPRWIVGHTSKDMHASTVIWEFYQKYTLE